MEITRVILRKRFADAPLCGVFTVVFDECFAVHDIKLVKKSNGGFMAVMPTKPDAFGRQRDVAHPLNEELRKALETKLTEKICENP